MRRPKARNHIEVASRSGEPHRKESFAARLRQWAEVVEQTSVWCQPIAGGKNNAVAREAGRFGQCAHSERLGVVGQKEVDEFVAARDC